MNEIILVKRSSGGSYYVEFIKDSGRVRIRCNCDAGSVGQICRHKRALLKGNAKMLFQADQLKPLEKILAWPELQSLLTKAQEYERELAELDAQMKQFIEREKVIKQHFGSDCLDGVHES